MIKFKKFERHHHATRPCHELSIVRTTSDSIRHASRCIATSHLNESSSVALDRSTAVNTNCGSLRNFYAARTSVVRPVPRSVAGRRQIHSHSNILHCGVDRSPKAHVNSHRPSTNPVVALYVSDRAMRRYYRRCTAYRRQSPSGVMHRAAYCRISCCCCCCCAVADRYWHTDSATSCDATAA